MYFISKHKFYKKWWLGELFVGNCGIDYFLNILSFKELPWQEPSAPCLHSSSASIRTHITQTICCKSCQGKVHILLRDSWCVWRENRRKAHKEVRPESSLFRHLLQLLRARLHLLTNRLSRALLKSRERGELIFTGYCHKCWCFVWMKSCIECQYMRMCIIE